jgi:hypothetical protein
MGHVDSYSVVWIAKCRYGAASTHRGKSARFAYIDGRVPVEIQNIFHVVQERNAASPLTADIVLVRRFACGNNMPDFPWVLRYVD